LNFILFYFIFENLDYFSHEKSFVLVEISENSANYFHKLKVQGSTFLANIDKFFSFQMIFTS